MTFHSLSRLNKDYLFVFLILWLGTGITINLNDQRAFNLQQMGIDAIVSYGTFTLGHSELPILKPLGDTFYVKKGIVPAKQPGQFVTGAVAYFVIKNMGLSYEENYNLTASLVTWMSASLVSAIALTLLFQLLKAWGYRQNQAMWAVITVGLCSHWLVFAGIAHHDIVATSYLVIALYFSEMNLLRTSSKRDYRVSNLLTWSKAHTWYYPLLAGFFAGLTIFTSMLPALMVLVFGLYLLASLQLKHIVFSGIGFILGLIPLGLYNNFYFDSPFTQANVAGNYADTFFKFNYDQFMHHLNAYVGWGGLSIWKYAPIMAVGLLGVALLKPGLLRIKMFIFAAFFVHLMYLVNIETLGTCQYGPRYLLPVLPFAAIGVAAWLAKVTRYNAFTVGIIFGSLAVFSFAVSMGGAMGGAMQCDLNNFVFIKYLNEHRKYRIELLPFFWWMFTAAILLLVYGAVYHLYQFRRNVVVVKEGSPAIPVRSVTKSLEIQSARKVVPRPRHEIKRLRIGAKSAGMKGSASKVMSTSLVEGKGDNETKDGGSKSEDNNVFDDSENKI